MMSSMTSAIRFITLALLAAFTSVTAQERSAASWSPTIAPVTSPAGTNSAQPQLFASARGLILSWVEREGPKASLRFAERTANGWSVPMTVASGTDWFVNWADVPSVIRLANGTLVGHWLQKSGPDTYAYDVRLSYSTDDGKTWSPSFLPHSDGTKTEHGFASLVQMPGAGLGLVWLDGRAMKPQAGHGDHGGGGAMSVRFGVFDSNWKQTAETPVDLRVCECCPTTAAVTADGPIVAFRNRTDDEVRDIYVSRLRERHMDRTEGGPRGRVENQRLPGQRSDVERAWTHSCPCLVQCKRRSGSGVRRVFTRRWTFVWDANPPG